MSFSVLEQLRSAREDMEQIERAMSMVLMEKAKSKRNPVSVEHSLHYLVQQAQAKAQAAVDIYQDKDGMRTDDVNALAGQQPGKKQGDVWTSFYDKVKEVKGYHRRFTINQGLPEVQGAEWFANQAFEADRSECLFSGEEDLGRRVDMHEHFMKYINMKKIATNRRAKFRDATFARLKKKNPEVKPEDPVVDEALDKEYTELDYIEWLKTFDQFHDIPRYCKYKDGAYAEYLNSVIAYLRGLLARTQPMVGIESLEMRFDKEFEERWADRSIPGWHEPTHKDKLFCLPSNRLFNNPSVLKSHMLGKQYKRKVAEMQRMSFDEQKGLVGAADAEDKRVAQLESRAAKWHDLLSDTIQETVQHLQKKQSQSVEEMEADRDDDDLQSDDGGVEIEGSDTEKDDEERPIYNPLNLPLGWDGKPIPFWLYKLHGLGIEYKCEICGNYSYWGRRAFEKHFSEWRHAFGMRTLGIPNTAHFKEITKIEDAIALYDKLKRDAEDQTFRPDQDVECEDIQGNVMSQRAFEDLRRQGLV